MVDGVHRCESRVAGELGLPAGAFGAYTGRGTDGPGGYGVTW